MLAALSRSRTARFPIGRTAGAVRQKSAKGRRAVVLPSSAAFPNRFRESEIAPHEITGAQGRECSARRDRPAAPRSSRSSACWVFPTDQRQPLDVGPWHSRVVGRPPWYSQKKRPGRERPDPSFQIDKTLELGLGAEVEHASEGVVDRGVTRATIGRASWCPCRPGRAAGAC